VDPVAFRSALHQGDRDIMYPLFKWLLSQLPILQKRAVIGYYLTMPEVPPEFRAIPDIEARSQARDG